MNQQTIQETFLAYCKNENISEAEINDPSVFYQSIAVKALTEAMDQDPKFAEESLVLIAKNFTKMAPYRACLAAFFVGLYGERGITSLYADRDLLDFFDLAVKYVMKFITEMIRHSKVNDMSEQNVLKMFKQVDINRLAAGNPELVEIMKGLPQLSTAVLSRISTNRSMRAYLRNCNLTAACVIVGYLIPATRYIGAMLNMVEQQQVLVLFPSNKIGFEVTIEEVDSNYLMFSLLQIALAKEGYMGKLGLPNYEYSKDIDMILSRSFAKDATLPNPLVDTAAFNYYNLHPIVKETRNRYRMDTDYLCVGEEHVDTLGTLDGRHILLADKRTVPRKWANSFVSGMHPNQHPKLTINRVIPKEEYESWIEMIEAIGAYQQDKEEA